MHANIGRNNLIWLPTLNLHLIICVIIHNKLGAHIHIQLNRLLEYGMKNVFEASKENGFGWAKFTKVPAKMALWSQYNEKE